MEPSSNISPVRMVGRYALYGEIAAGGMATVHFGRLLGPVGFSRTVAIKQLHPQYAKDPEFLTMFLDEARLAARIRHPNVVPTLDIVNFERELFLVMDYVPGESLARLARSVRNRKEQIPPRILAAILCGALHGLHAAHEARDEKGEPLGIVHRDISPQNILVGSDGVARVLDFGVAKAGGRIQTTREGQLKGKLAYMAPEQITGKVTRKTDIYAASVVLWEALAGARLFTGENEGEILGKVLGAEVEAPSRRAVSEGAPQLKWRESLDAVALKGLDRDPAKRYATAREMAAAIEACIQPASPPDVGEWVERWAGEMLNARAEKIAEIESSSSVKITASDFPAKLAQSESAELEASGPISGPRPLKTSEFPTAVSSAEPAGEGSSPNSHRSSVSLSKLAIVVVPDNVAPVAQHAPSRRHVVWISSALVATAAGVGLWIHHRAPATSSAIAITAPSPAPIDTQTSAPAPSAEIPQVGSTASAAPAITTTPSSDVAKKTAIAATTKPPPPHLPTPTMETDHGVPPDPTTVIAAPSPTTPPPAPPPVSVAATASPPPAPFDPSGAHVDLGSARCSGTTQSSVARMLGPVSARITQCYRASLTSASVANPGVGTLHLQTDESGFVTDARVSGATLPNAARCIEGAVRGRQIPGVDTGSAAADVPLLLRPR